MMKKCPFCGADIEKSARFCLYCMQSLTEKEQIITHQKKKPQWFMIIAAIVMPILVFAVVLFNRQITLGNETPSDTLSDTLPVTEAAHTPAAVVTEKYIESSCTETGSYDEVVYCSECQVEISRTQKNVDKKPHDHNQKVTTAEYLKTEASCTDSAVYYYSCSCGAIGDTTFVEGKANGHSFASTWDKNTTHHWHKATCEHTTEMSAKSEHDYGTDNICDTCGYAKTVNVSGGAGGSIGSGNSSGSSGSGGSASACSHSSTRTEHKNEVASTCTATGVYDEVVYCSSCGKELSKITQTIPQKPHTFDKWIVDKVSTCMEMGTKHRVCSVCDESESDTIPVNATAHNYANTWTIDNTYHWYKCLNSGCTSVSERTAHSFGEWIVDNVATCVNTGTHHHVCSICQVSKSETYTNPNYHNYDTAWTIDDTHHWHKCLRIGCTSVSGKVAHNITDGSCADCCVKSVDNDTYTRDGNYIYFGEYPQSLKADDVTITANMDVRGYYVGSDGCYYAKVGGNPFNTVKFQSGEYVQRKIYYFKVEPIRWRILSEDGDTALILCDSIIANKAYNEDRRTSTYEQSTIRTWLNVQFYNATFNEFQKSLITTTLVDNEFGNNTNDKVFLLNRKDIINADYGFESSDVIGDTARLMVVSDYARATGTKMCSDNHGYWMLGEAHFGSYADSMNVLLVGDNGRADYYSIITGDCWGVVPALQIRLNDTENHVNSTGLFYRVNEDSTTCTVTGFGTCTETEVVIPDEIDGMKVTSIGDSAFWGSTITSITIPDGVMTIGDNAFGCCKQLTSIMLPDSVNSIGNYAFAYCSKLTSVTLGENSKLTSISSYAFNNCNNLTSVTIPASVTIIGEKAFAECYNISVYITDLAAWCEISFNDADSNPICSNWTSNFYLNGQLIKELVIPDGVTTIKDYAFDDFYYIKDFTIPNSVTSIGERSFYNCGNLKSVNFSENSKLTTIGNWAFYGCNNLMSITIPDSVTSIGDKTFKSCTSLTSITIPDGVTCIGNQTFYGCQSLSSVTIPDSVTSIGDEVFYGCASLTSIKYRGTESQWQSITKGTAWDSNTSEYTITYDYVGE